MVMQFLYFKCLVLMVEAQYIRNFVPSQIYSDEGWTIQYPSNGATTYITNCGGNTIFGGYQVFGCYIIISTQVMKYFILPPHYNLRIDIKYWKIDDWPLTQNFYVNADSSAKLWHVSSNAGTNLCGGSGTESNSLLYNGYIMHTLNSVIAIFYSDCDTTNFWGLTDFSISLFECYQGCLFCLDSTVDCMLWILWQSYFDLQNLDNGFEGWIKGKFPSFQYLTNSNFQFKQLVLNQGESAIKYFKFPDHNSLIIQFRVEYLSNSPKIFQIYLNDEQQLEFTTIRPYVDYRSPIIKDSQNLIKLEIRSTHGKIGIREISIILRGPINLIQCIDDNFEPFDGCFSKQESCLQGCEFCVNGECLLCDTKWVYNELTNNCDPLCGDKFIIVNEQCDDGNDFPFDGCYQCQFSCRLNCQNCLFGICQECITGYYYSNGICYKMQEYIFHETNILLSDNLNINQPSFTFYDDINLNQIQIYYQEKSKFENEFKTLEFYCSPFCQVCVFGKCKQCIDNHFLLKNQCISRITQGVLLFEDGIHLSRNQIGCYQCNDSCQIQCLQCLNSSCILCMDGWQIFDGYCIQVCGDNQVAQLSKEQCDSSLEDCLNCNIVCHENCQYCVNTLECVRCDQTYIEIDHKCQLACSKDCKNCINGTCLDNISNGNNVSNGNNKIDDIKNSICGDGIRQQQELCDDGNNIQFDGCFNCKYSCPLYCVNCIDGSCQECEKQLKLQYNQCYEYCGNGIKNQDELCDDGNIIDADGCSSNCKIEVDYKCYENYYGQSECQFYQAPYMILKLLNQTFNKYYIEISFSQAIYFKDNYDLESLYNISIDGMRTEDYAIKLESNYKPTINQVLNFLFQIEISLFISTNGSFTQTNILLVNEVFNQDEIKLLNPSEKILLKQYIKMNEADIEKTKKLSEYQYVMIIAQGIVSLISIITGNFQMLIEILDNLQYLSNLKYINIVYPENLYLFFESTNIISVNPILDYLTISENFERYIYQDYIQSNAKLKFYNLNADLITNLQFFFIQVITIFVFSIILNTITYISIKLCQNKLNRHFPVSKVKGFKQKLQLKIIMFIYNILHHILNFINKFNLNGVQNILLANAWDLLFKTFLYLTSYQSKNKVSLIQSVISYLFLVSLGYTMISLLKHSFKKNKIRMNDKYKAFYLLKQFLFCYCLICIQNDQFIQLLMLTTTNLIYLNILIFVKLNLQTMEKIQIIIQEISIIVFTFTSIFHLQDYNYLIGGQNQITLGFSQIYLLMPGLLWIFIKYIIMIVQKIKQKCIQKKKKKKNKKFKKVTHLIFEMVS